MGRDKSQGAGKSQMDEKQDFSMEEYIEKRMMEITDLDQRRMFKQTVGISFLRFIPTVKMHLKNWKMIF